MIFWVKKFYYVEFSSHSYSWSIVWRVFVTAFLVAQKQEKKNNRAEMSVWNGVGSYSGPRSSSLRCSLFSIVHVLVLTYAMPAVFDNESRLNDTLLSGHFQRQHNMPPI